MRISRKRLCFEPQSYTGEDHGRLQAAAERETRHRASGVSAYVDAPRGFWAPGGRLDAPAYVDAPRGFWAPGGRLDAPAYVDAPRSFWALGGRLGASAYANAQQKIC